MKKCKSIALITALIMALSAASCGQPAKESQPDPAPEAAESAVSTGAAIDEAEENAAGTEAAAVEAAVSAEGTKTNSLPEIPVKWPL